MSHPLGTHSLEADALELRASRPLSAANGDFRKPSIGINPLAAGLFWATVLYSFIAVVCVGAWRVLSTLAGML